MWRALLKGRELLIEGIRWQVGSGDSVRVFKDSWLPMPRSFKTISNSLFLQDSLMVSDLIKNQKWQRSLIQGLFLQRDVDLILNIPLCPQRRDDRQVWHYTKDGVFSVSSAYRLGQEIKWSHHRPQSSNTLLSTRQWTQLWSLNVPPKVKHLGWRISTNTLPCKDNLSKRFAISSVCCPWCNASQETQVHALLTCDFAVACWNSAHINPQDFLQIGCSWPQFWDNIFTTAGEHQTNKVIMGCWAIWTARNNMVFNGTQGNPNIIISGALKLLEQYQLKQQSLLPTHVVRAVDEKWQKPTVGIFKVNVDAHWKETQASFGVIIRNHHGAVVSAAAGKIEDAKSPEEAELHAIWQGVRLAQMENMPYVLESDCLSLVKKLNSTNNNFSTLGAFIDWIKELKGKDTCITHVSRKHNVTAHRLAQFGISSLSTMFWQSVVPPEIDTYVQDDIS